MIELDIGGRIEKPRDGRQEGRKYDRMGRLCRQMIPSKASPVWRAANRLGCGMCVFPRRAGERLSEQVPVPETAG